VPDPKQLPYLIALLEDDSPQVREAVLEEFAAFGESLEDHLKRLELPDGPKYRRLIEGLIRSGRRTRFERAWKSLDLDAPDKTLLEAGHTLIAQFLQEPPADTRLSDALDALAQEFTRTVYDRDALALSEFLFQTKALGGAQDSYYNPQNSNLLHVIRSGEGLPISLCCIYMLVGSRLGLTIDGCNLPGHFLALASYAGRKFVVDCFNGGVVLLDTDLARLNPSAPVHTTDLAALQCDAEIILMRVLRNLHNAYRRREDDQAAEDSALFQRLLESGLPGRTRKNP